MKTKAKKKSEVQHTSIPWGYKIGEHGTCILGSDATGNANIGWYSDGFHWSASGISYNVTAEEAIANAKFVVRACNNYAALKGTVETLVDILRQNGFDTHSTEIVAAKDLLKYLDKGD